MKFGKYTLFSLYGTTANGSMYPVAFTIVFGNENTDAWNKFWKFTAGLHPSLNDPTVTIITDQNKGSITAIAEHVPNAFHFHCSYHHAANVLKNCKGGKVKHLPNYVFKKMVRSNSIAELDWHENRLFSHLNQKEG